MFSITVVDRFSAAHSLLDLPDSHKCSRIHGHNYKVKFTIYSEHYNQSGMILDFRIVKDCLKRVTEDELDHRMLNHIPALGGKATAERLAEYIGKKTCEYLLSQNEADCGIITCIQCMVQETEDSSATFSMDTTEIFSLNKFSRE